VIDIETAQRQRRFTKAVQAAAGVERLSAFVVLAVAGGQAHVVTGGEDKGSRQAAGILGNRLVELLHELNLGLRQAQAELTPPDETGRPPVETPEVGVAGSPDSATPGAAFPTSPQAGASRPSPASDSDHG
jgi:hypothetical protein